MPDDPKETNRNDKDNKEGRDIQDVIREEQARRKKHIDTNEIAKRKRVGAAIIELARDVDDEQVFRNELTSLLEPGTERFERAFAAWRELKRRRF